MDNPGYFRHLVDHLAAETKLYHRVAVVLYRTTKHFVRLDCERKKVKNRDRRTENNQSQISLTTVTSYECCKCLAQDKPAIPPPIIATVDFLLFLLFEFLPSSPFLALSDVVVDDIAVLREFVNLTSCILGTIEENE